MDNENNTFYKYHTTPDGSDGTPSEFSELYMGARFVTYNSDPSSGLCLIAFPENGHDSFDLEYACNANTFYFVDTDRNTMTRAHFSGFLFRNGVRFAGNVSEEERKAVVADCIRDMSNIISWDVRGIPHGMEETILMCWIVLDRETEEPFDGVLEIRYE